MRLFDLSFVRHGRMEYVQRYLDAEAWSYASSRHKHSRGSQLHRTYNSLSWRLTRPLRMGSSFLFKVKRFLWLVVTTLLEKLIRWLSRRPRVKDKCLRLAYRFPRIRGRLMAFAAARGYGVQPFDWLDDGQEGQWYIDAPKGTVAQWEILLRDTSRLL